MIERQLREKLLKFMDMEKAVILKGARQVGKTTLLKSLIPTEAKTLWIDGDDPAARAQWSNISKVQLQLFISDVKYIIVDEAQRIENIGLATKMIIDMQLEKQVILSGSSSIQLSSSIKEALTGRKWTLELFPLSWAEIVKYSSLSESLLNLDLILTYGTYPEIYTAKDRKQRRLKELSSSYLYMDILLLADIRKPEILDSLLRALAYQVGSEVSYNELAKTLRVNQETIKKYIDLLEENFVIFRVEPLSRNPRKEISTSRKIYFYDNGILNSIINRYEPIDLRNDKGAVWENFVFSEFFKYISYNDIQAKVKFWRSKTGPEIDLILDYESHIDAYEIKYSNKKNVKFNQVFIERYQPQKLSVIHRQNFYEYFLAFHKP